MREFPDMMSAQGPLNLVVRHQMKTVRLVVAVGAAFVAGCSHEHVPCAKATNVPSLSDFERQVLATAKAETAGDCAVAGRECEYGVSRRADGEVAVFVSPFLVDGDDYGQIPGSDEIRIYGRDGKLIKVVHSA